MATFNEIYHSYLNGMQGIAPISGQQGITSLAKPIVPNTNDNANTNTNYSNNFNQDPNAKSMYSNYYMDNLGFGDILGGISGLASKAMGYPDVGYAIGALTGLGSGGPGMSYGASNYSGAVDTQDYGREADNVSNGGVSASEAGMGDGMSDLADGGRVGYAGGGRKKIYDLGKKLLNNKKEKTFGGLQINMSDAMDDARLMKEMGLQGGKPGDYDKFLEMKLSGELGPQKQMQTIKMELFNRYSNFLDDATMDLVQSSNNPQKVAEVYANVKEASILRDRGLGTEEIVDTIVNTPRTKQADGTRPQGLNYLMGY